MSQTENRKLFSFPLTSEEKALLDSLAAKNGMTRAAFVRFKIFQQNTDLVESTRNRLGNNLVPEVNVKTYRTLKEIADRLDRLNEIAKEDNTTENSLINLDRELLEKTLAQVNKIGAHLAIASSKI